MKGRFLWAVGIALLMASHVAAQIDLTATPVKSIAGLEDPRIVGDVVLVGDDSKPAISQVGLITVKSTYKFIDVVARKSLFEEAVLTPLGDAGDTFLLVGEGRWLVQVTAFDPEKGIAKKSAELVIGKPVPPITDPTNPPTDPKPPGDFAAIANLARTSADAVKDAPTKAALSAAILEAISRVPAEAPVTQAQAILVTAIEATLLKRTGASRSADWNTIWRRPLNDAVLAAKITETANYLACMKAVAEAMK